MNKDFKTELLAPAGSYDAFRAGLNAGADAFYLGGSRFGARAFAENFTEEALLRTINEAHLFGKQVYLTINTLFKEKEAQELYDYLLPYYREGLDAVIIQDPGIVKLIKEAFPGLQIHASTQMTVTGYRGARLLENIGVKRVVPARELSLEEIREIRDNTSLEIECFVHGALCYCYSGQCLMSSFIGGRSGNRGRCAQPCRMPYSVLEGGRLISGEKNPYALNTKDICLIDQVGELMEAGIDSFKIEGRMKRPEYTAGVVSVYRKYIDLYMENREKIRASESDRQLLADLFNRDGFSTGYFFCHNKKSMMALKNARISESRTEKAEEAYSFVKKEVIASDIKKPVNGSFVLTPDNNARLLVTADDITVEASFGDVQESLNRPLTKEIVSRQLQRTGGTEFEFRELNISITDNGFMTMKQLNELRRNAFEELRGKLILRYRRTDEPLRPEFINKGRVNTEASEVWVSVLNREQFDAVKKIEGIDGFYLPIDLCIREFSETELEKYRGKLYIALPYISRSTKNHSYTGPMIDFAQKGFGFLVRSLEDAAFLVEEGYASNIRLDCSLYTMNSMSRLFWEDLGVTENTVPLELNRKEISGRDNSNSDMILYGRVPLMISAQCIRKSYGECSHSYGNMVLKDRRAARFPVSFQCDQCYNIVYNSVPVSLLSLMDKVKELNVKRYRIMLTFENPKDGFGIVSNAVKVIKGDHLYKETFEFTRGHFNRGVE